MAKINATEVSILVAGTEISLLTNCELEINRAMIDVTNKDSDKWKEHLVGLIDWNMSGDIVVDFSSTYNADEIFTALLAGTDLTVKFGVPGGGSAGYTKYSGTGHYTQQGFSAGVQDKYTSKFRIEGTGALAQGTAT